MDAFKLHMKIQNIGKLYLVNTIIFCEQGFNTLVYIFWLCRFFTTHFIRKPFVTSNSNPLFLAVGSICFENKIQLFQMGFSKTVCGIVDDIINATKVIDCFKNIVNTCVFGRNTERVSLKNITCLFFS